MILIPFLTISLTSLTSAAFLTKDTATISTPISSPKFKSSLSLVVIADTDSLESGNATP